MEKKYCDLHTHSNFSDGTYTPRELLREGESLGLSAIALCDHNTVAGLWDFIHAAKDFDIEAVAGTELSTDYEGKELHIVGLFINPSHFDKITALVEKMQHDKEKNYRELIDRLYADGYKLSYDKISKKSETGRINRAHIAEALFEAGYVRSIQDAFLHLLSKSGGYYKEPKYIPATEAISFLKSIGAVAVLAHPYLSLSPEEVREFLPIGKAAGLDAMETVYSKYSDKTTEIARKAAKEFGILESGGSDFHGSRKPDIALGRGKGSLRIPSEFLEKLKEKL